MPPGYLCLTLQSGDSDHFVVISCPDQALVPRVRQSFHASSDGFEGVVDGLPVIVVISVVTVDDVSVGSGQRRDGKEAQQNCDVAVHVQFV